jgi:hypothetical protein
MSPPHAVGAAVVQTVGADERPRTSSENSGVLAGTYQICCCPVEVVCAVPYGRTPAMCPEASAHAAATPSPEISTAVFRTPDRKQHDSDPPEQVSQYAAPGATWGAAGAAPSGRSLTVYDAMCASGSRLDPRGA